MQLKNKRTVGASIATATCGLLGTLHTGPVVAEEDKNWQVDSALLFYGESDGRVKDLSLSAAIRRAFDERRTLNLTLTVDSLTGASPSGAVPGDSVQTFTRPSGHGTYQIAAGNQPVDDTFKDTRIAASASWRQSFGESLRLQGGLSLSNEYDYRHAGIDGRIERDFNQRNTTAYFGVAYGKDDVDPVGGAPIGLAAMRGVDDFASKQGSDSKDVLDALVGVTQVLSRRALLELTYSYSTADGYLNDPYKVVSVVNPLTGRPVAGPDAGLGLYLYEQRPDSRTKQSLFGELRYAFDRDSMAVSYRFMHDDWGIASHTLDVRYRWNIDASRYLEPHVRYYRQNAADFYQPYLLNGAPLPQFVSADYRLAEMNAYTAGAKFGWRTRGGEYSARLEYYRQDGTAPSGAPGVLGGLDLNPSLSAVIVQFGYKFRF